MIMIKLQKILVVLIAVGFTLALSGLAGQCRDISDNVLRLHIIANSDSMEDQNLKLKVRDTILSDTKDLFSKAKNRSDAENIVNENADKILKIARETVEEEGYKYPVSLEVVDESFPTKSYEDITLPAGEYRAVRVIIGNGEGHNWWCVMFPSLCIPSSSDISLDMYFSDNETSFVKSDPKVDVRFKCVELFEKMRERIK